MIDLKQAYYTTHHQKYPDDFIFDERLTESYELVCFLSGTDCRMLLDGKEYRVKDGDVVFRKPGQSNISYMPFESIQLKFDADMALREMLNELEHHHLLGTIGDYRSSFHQIYHETLRGNRYGFLLIQARMLEIIYGLLNEKRHNSERISSGNPDLIGLLQYMDSHIQDKFQMEDMARAVGISRRKVFGLFKKELGTSPSRHLTELRLNYASKMLAQSNLTVEEIAYRSGFESHTYFITVFRKHRGQTPAVYRKTSRGFSDQTTNPQ